MRRTTVHRGIVALAIVTSLAFAGARPAAARELGALDRFHQLWSAFVGAPVTAPGLWDRMGDKLAGWFGSSVPTKAVSPPPPASPDKGWGMDPNGSTTASTTPTVPAGGGN